MVFFITFSICKKMHRNGGAGDEHKLLGGRAGSVLPGRPRRRSWHSRSDLPRGGRVLPRDPGAAAKRIPAAGEGPRHYLFRLPDFLRPVPFHRLEELHLHFPRGSASLLTTQSTQPFYLRNCELGRYKTSLYHMARLPNKKDLNIPIFNTHPNMSLTNLQCSHTAYILLMSRIMLTLDV